jgi:nucleoside-diphosphate-sugar epimerase
MRPVEGGLEVVQADATDPQQLERAISDAGVVYNCANAPYDKWPELLPPLWDGILNAVISRADASGDEAVRYVIASNLYAFGAPGPQSNPGAEPLTAHHAIAPCTRKGRVRAALEQKALAAGRENENLRVAIVRASDFYGPEVRESALGDRFFPAVLERRPATVYGRDVPHSYAYLPDFAQAAVDLGTVSPGADVWGRSWIAPHAPAATATKLEAVVRELTGDAKVRIMGPGMLRFGALFVPAAREMVEMMYEFTHPFTVDAAETTEVLGTVHTRLENGLARTLEWYRSVAPAPEGESADERVAKA